MNRYPLTIFWSEEDKGFIAEVPDLPGCAAWGKTEADARRAARHAIAAWLQAAKAAECSAPKRGTAAQMLKDVRELPALTPKQAKLMERSAVAQRGQRMA